ncbi:MAG: SWIM zinc finger family protein [Xenococcus sp. MO_188.B8]|nr:SWIM zinc finger family protein [Xenococcus sp. MO_188.B8]
MTFNQIETRQWWVERWLELLDSYRFKKRLERGRNYAREGNVLSIEFVDTLVLADVQGSEDQPYQVSLSLEPFADEDREKALKHMSQPPFNDEDWDCVIQSLSEKAIFSAQLLAGEMPSEIEAVFTSNGLSLFPYTLSDVRSRCTCPDKANPCKHIAAVYYQLGDRFSEDPFLIFQLRGRTREQILASLRQLRSQNQDEVNSEELVEIRDDREPSLEQEQVDARQDFWQYDEPLDPSLVVIVPPLENKNILDILGKMPLPNDDAEAVNQYLTEVYRVTSQGLTAP